MSPLPVFSLPKCLDVTFTQKCPCLIEVSLHKGLVVMLKENVDTLTLLYSTPEDPKVDVGIILEKGKEPMAIEWTHSPHFILRLITAEETKTVLLGNAGVRTVLKHFED